MTPGDYDPYNPLEKINLAKSIQLELLRRPVAPLGDFGAAPGAGVYVIYYTGPFPAYEPIAAANAAGRFDQPIYIGKAIPAGGRKGGLQLDAAAGTPLANRLRDHAKSIREVANLDLDDFHVRHLIVDDIWIPLGENMLIESFQPAWNRAVDGFGNKVPGKRRSNQFKSPWDVLHPGRRGFENLGDSGLTPEQVVVRIADLLAGRPLTPLPKKLAAQQEADTADAIDAADDIPLGDVE